MVKIIQKGKPKRVTCDICGCLFEYEEQETKYRGCIKTINCPQCKTLISAYSGRKYK